MKFAKSLNVFNFWSDSTNVTSLKAVVVGLLQGDEPWKVMGIKEKLTETPLSWRERRKLTKYINKQVAIKQEELFTTGLAKVLVGNSTLTEVTDDARTLGRKTWEAQQPKVSAQSMGQTANTNANARFAFGAGMGSEQYYDYLNRQQQGVIGSGSSYYA